MTKQKKDLYGFGKESVQQLTNAGYIAYFAGGWVRDYLMDHPSNDIDIGTNAPAEVIVRLFPNALHVGAAFGVYIVPYGIHQVEISIFRKDVEYINGRKPERIEPATPEEDAQRRDFTINGMFYDPLKDVIHDWVHGAEDIKKKVIRTIGVPDERFFEDRLRMVRCVRFASRFQFNIESETREAIMRNAYALFPAVSMERIWQELSKMSKYPNFDHAIVELHQLNLLGEIFPELKAVHLKEIKQKVAKFHQYPKDTPLPAYLLQLFPQKSFEALEELLRAIKGSRKDYLLIEFLKKGEAMLHAELASADNTAWDWSHFYADPRSQLCLDLYAVNHTVDPGGFLALHEKQKAALQPFIDRILYRKPVVTSEHLRQEGIPNGKQMGILLLEAEKIATNANLQQAEQVIARLKQTPYWTQT